MPGQAGQPLVPADQPGPGGLPGDHRGAVRRRPAGGGRRFSDGSWFSTAARAASAPDPDRRRARPRGPAWPVPARRAPRPGAGTGRGRPQQPPGRLPQRVGGDQPLDLPHEPGVHAEGELGAEAVLRRQQPELAEPGRLGGQAGSRSGDIRVRLPAPSPAAVRNRPRACAGSVARASCAALANRSNSAESTEPTESAARA